MQPHRFNHPFTPQTTPTSYPSGETSSMILSFDFVSWKSEKQVAELKLKAATQEEKNHQKRLEASRVAEATLLPSALPIGWKPPDWVAKATSSLGSSGTGVPEPVVDRQTGSVGSSAPIATSKTNKTKGKDASQNSKKAVKKGVGKDVKDVTDGDETTSDVNQLFSFCLQVFWLIFFLVQYVGSICVV